MFETPEKIYNHLVQKLQQKINKEIIPKPDDSTNNIDTYMEKISNIKELEKYVITKEKLANLVPEPADQAKRSAWRNREENLEGFAKKISLPEVILIQGVDGSIHARLALEDTIGKVYEKTPDINLAYVLGEIINKHLFSKLSQQDRENRKNILETIVEQIPLLSANTTLFYEALVVAFEKGKVANIEEGEYLHIIKNVSDDFGRDGMQKIYEKDQKLLQVFDRPLIERLGHKLYVKHSEKNPHEITKDNLGIAVLTVGEQPNESPGVLITTSNGGACHKTIAKQIITQLIKSGIDCALINESELFRSDPLKKMIGIFSSDLYPVVFQQCHQRKCQMHLKSIERELSHFIPALEFTQLRMAVRICENNYERKEVKIKVAYSTQHYATDLRAISKNTLMRFQVCDYQQLAKLSNLAILAGSIPAEQQRDLIKFFIPSSTCLTRRTLQKGDKELFVEVVYPTLILPGKEVENKFNEFFTTIPVDELIARSHELHDPQDTTVERFLIMMGGQGCGDLIEKYVDQFLEEIRNYYEDKIELIIACGNNEILKEDLLGKIKSLKLPKNVKLKICGPIPNDQLIAYNKNAVLITKPGGGSISECIQNDIQALIHYDKNHWWEGGNALEIIKEGLGEVIVGNPHDSIENLAIEAKGEKVPLKDEKESLAIVKLIEKVKSRNKMRIKRNAESKQNTKMFREGILKFCKKVNKANENVKEVQSFIEYLHKTNEILKEIKQDIEKKSPKDYNVLPQLYSLTSFLKKKSTNEKLSVEANQTLEKLTNFLQQFKAKPVVEQIISEIVKAKP